MAQRAPLEPTNEEVVRAVRSLYEDEIRPFGRILMKRIREQAAPPGGDAEAVPLLDPRHLRRVCEACPSLRVELAEGREFVASLAGQADCFVDACSLLDPYPARLWEEAAAYFDGLDVAAESLPCGRYACAAELVRRALPFLAGRSLGEVCHIVQLAISAKKLLGHAAGRVVPYSSSDENARARSAVRQMPMASPEQGEEALPYATWEDLREGLRLILRCSSKPAPGTITLSNMKRLFRSDLRLELTETALGHARVLELLQDARLRDVCWLELIGNGQALAVPAVDVSSGLSDGSTELATSAGATDCESSSVVDQRPGSSRSDLDLEQCLAGTGEELQGAGLSPAFKSCGFVVRNTFIDAAPERQAGASRRCRSVPREMHFAMHE